MIWQRHCVTSTCATSAATFIWFSSSKAASHSSRTYSGDGLYVASAAIIASPSRVFCPPDNSAVPGFHRVEVLFRTNCSVKKSVALSGQHKFRIVRYIAVLWQFLRNTDAVVLNGDSTK